MKNVYLVSKDSSTKIQRLDYDEAESQIPKELGLRLSSLFMFDRLVFVEGPSDEAVFREWASTLKINFSQANVGFVSMGGVRNFTHYAAEATLTFLTRRQVGIWFIIDRDEQTDQEVASLRELFEGRAQVKVLSRRELENYMIFPRLIREFISEKRELGERKADSLPTEEDISEELQTAAAALKQLAIDKRVVKALCKPAYPSHKKIFAPTSADAITARVSEELDKVVNELQSAKTRLPDELTAQTEIVNRSWEADKFALVPGDMLLDRVCQEHGVRFKKERDSARMAALMTEAEIDRSIKEIIREIGRASV